MPFAVRVNVGRVAFSHVCFFRSMLPTRHKEGLTQFGKISLENFSTLYQGLNPVLSAALSLWSARRHENPESFKLL